MPPEDTVTGSFPAGASGAPTTKFNPFDSDAGAPPPPTDVSGAPREVRDPITRQVEPTRVEPTTPPARQAPVAPTTPPAAATPGTSPSAAPGAVTMTDAQLQALALSLRPQAAPAAQAPQQPTMSDEEFRKTFNIHRVTPEAYESILGIKPTSQAQVDALDAQLQAVSKQSVTLTRYLMEQEVNKLRTELGAQIRPAREALLAQQAQQHYTTFVTTNPDLKDYTPLLQELVVSTKAKIDRGEMANFRDSNEAAQFVASQARKLLNLPVPQPGQAPAVGQPPSRQSGGSRTMSTTSMGGRSGQSGGAAPVKGLAERLFAEQDT